MKEHGIWCKLDLYTSPVFDKLARIQVLPDAPVWPPRDVVGKLHEVDEFLMCDVVV